MARPKVTKPDKNQKQIVEELRALGFDVDIICNLPGLYDIIVCSGNRCVRVEVKMPGKSLSDNEYKYYKDQKHPGSYLIAYCTHDVQEWFVNQYNGKCDGLKACPYLV